MLEWLIVGGGIHGTHLSHVLVHGRGVDRDRVAVLDPHATPLQRWRECTRAIGMRHLRSPGVHHLDLDPFALHRFAPAGGGAFAPPYDRPSLELFNTHCDAIVREGGLDALRIRGAATGLSAVPDGYRVDTGRGAIEARRVVLALGLGDQVAWTGWALALGAAGANVEHVFAPGFDRRALPRGPTLVVGGGITAGQLALALVRDGREVVLWMRHPMRVHQFDSDPGWIGPRFMEGFRAERDSARRRAQIAGARHRGSMPMDVADEVGAAIRSGALRLAGGDFVRAAPVAGGLVLETSSGTYGAAAAVLCTGFDARRPGGAWLDRAVDELGLTCAACGYPVPDARLQWRPGLFVMGPLSELELGPTARNITGARSGAQRIAAA
ncbi:MAG: FAD/NAD(P)-binding protein [Deltaproteobacteria bacterium]|nr:FAD/NAD(P)-binding protein [Deltaproteobacteria bacterium]